MLSFSSNSKDKCTINLQARNIVQGKDMHTRDEFSYYNFYKINHLKFGSLPLIVFLLSNFLKAYIIFRVNMMTRTNVFL